MERAMKNSLRLNKAKKFLFFATLLIACFQVHSNEERAPLIGTKMLKKYGGPDPALVHSFKQHWPNIKPTTRKLIFQEPVTTVEWQNLFYDVHNVCSWDAKGPSKLLKKLEYELRDTYLTSVKTRLRSIDDGHQLLKEYNNFWIDFRRHCDRFPVAFQQLDLATRGVFAKVKRSNQPTAQTKNEQQENKENRSPRTQAPSIKPQHDSTVRCLMLKLWDESVVTPLGTRLQECANQLIRDERLGSIVESWLAISLRESFCYLDELRFINSNSYTQSFEDDYVESVQIFYLHRADEYLRDRGILAYIDWALDILDKEEVRAMQYLDDNSTAILRAQETCNKVFIDNFVDQILIASRNYVRDNDIENLKLIFKFLSRRDRLVEQFLVEFGDHVFNIGFNYLTNLDRDENPEKFVGRLLDIYRQFSKIVTISFSNDQRAIIALERAFSSIVNEPRAFRSQLSNLCPQLATPSKNPLKIDVQPVSRCAEILANYCNLLFRKSAFNRKLTSDDLTNRLNEVLLIIKLINRKDSFVKAHKTHLIRRLILDATVNYEKEEEFVVDLKNIEGISVEKINELAHMFRDLKSSQILQGRFLKAIELSSGSVTVNNNNNDNNNTISISNMSVRLTNQLNLKVQNNQFLKESQDSISVRVLNPSAWIKIGEELSIKLPDRIESVMTEFDQFYKNQYEGRELYWCNQLSNGVIEFCNRKGAKYDLEVSASQLAILQAFNSSPSDLKSFEELGQFSRLNALELRRTLWVSSYA